MAAPAQGADSAESASDPKQTPNLKKPSSSFYGYLFQKDKAPTPVLNDLLVAIGKYIVSMPLLHLASPLRAS